MRKQVIMVAATILITGIILSGCGSKEETSASAGEVTRETSAEEITTDSESEAAKQETTTNKATTSKVTETTSKTTEPATSKVVNNITEGNTVYQPEETTVAYVQPQTEAVTQAPIPEPQTEVPTPASEPQTEAVTQAPIPEPQTEAPTPVPEPQTEAPTQPQKTQAEYLEEFKQNYSNLRRSLYGDTAAGNPQWNETLYKIAKLRADEIVGYNFGHTSPNGYLNGYHTLECITQDPAYRYAWEGWCHSSDHYEILCNQRMDMYAVAVGEGGCVFLAASSKDWNGEAYADYETAINEKEAKTLAMNDYGATEQNWKEVLENEVLWWICKDETGNERFDITYDVYIQEYWQSCFDWYTQHYGEKVIK